MHSLNRSNGIVSDITNALSNSTEVSVQVDLLDKLSKQASKIQKDQLGDVLHVLATTLNSDEADVILQSIRCTTELLQQFSTEEKVETSKKLSLIVDLRI